MRILRGIIRFALSAALAGIIVTQLGTQGGLTPGAGPPPPPWYPPTPTPVPPRIWYSLPGFAGTFSDWGGTPDHHDGGAGEHAVDIGAGSCTDATCPLVGYYDRSGSATATVIAADAAVCFDPSHTFEGYKVLVHLTSLNPPGVIQGTAVYLHLRVPTVAQGQVPVDGTVLGQVNPDLVISACWDGAHLHQGVRDVAPAATLTHLTGPGSNCESNHTAVVTTPCYSISW